MNTLFNHLFTSQFNQTDARLILFNLNMAYILTGNNFT